MALEKNARAKGFLLIARKVSAGLARLSIDSAPHRCFRIPEFSFQVTATWQPCRVPGAADEPLSPPAPLSS